MRTTPSGFTALAVLVHAGLPAPVATFPAVLEVVPRSFGDGVVRTWHGNPRCDSWGHDSTVKAAVATVADAGALNGDDYGSDTGCVCALTGDDTLAAWVDLRSELAHLLLLERIVAYYDGSDGSGDADEAGFGLVQVALADLESDPPKPSGDPSVDAHADAVLARIRAAMPAWAERLTADEGLAGRAARLNRYLAPRVASHRDPAALLIDDVPVQRLLTEYAAEPDQLLSFIPPVIELRGAEDAWGWGGLTLFQVLGCARLIGVLPPSDSPRRRLVVRASKLAAEWLRLEGHVNVHLLGPASPDPAEDTMELVSTGLALIDRLDLPLEATTVAASGILSATG